MDAPGTGEVDTEAFIARAQVFRSFPIPEVLEGLRMSCALGWMAGV